jgi:starch synthase
LAGARSASLPAPPSIAAGAWLAPPACHYGYHALTFTQQCADGAAHRMTDRFALHLVPNDDSIGGAGLLRAIARDVAIERIGVFGAAAADAEAVDSLLRAHGYRGQVEPIPRGRPQDIAPFGTLYHPAPDIARLAWRRLGIGARRYSLCGIIDDTASHAAMSAVAGLLAAPVHGWDALVCTSRVVRDSVRQVLERQAEYLGARLGAQRFELPQLPLIPPGVHGADLAVGDGARAAARRRLEIGADDVAFLSCHAADPQQMFAALERACRQHPQAGRLVHLILCGGSAQDAGAAAEAALREAAAALCPSIRLAVLDGRDADNQAAARGAADVFTALADNIQQTFGLTPAEAMAAGLPCVVSDWGGDRDTVRDGVDGYRIPTTMPGAGAGLDLAQRYDDGVDSYDRYCGHIGQAVALDGGLLAEAYGRLIGDAGLRRQLGENARLRACREFDWAVVFGRYRALWGELDERRRADAALAPALPHTVPDRQDPFALFASYPSARIAPASLVELMPDASLALLREYRALAINRFAADAFPTLEEFGQIFGSIGSRPMQVDELLDILGPCDRPTLLRGLAWLCKMDLLRIAAADA